MKNDSTVRSYIRMYIVRTSKKFKHLQSLSDVTYPQALPGYRWRHVLPSIYSLSDVTYLQALPDSLWRHVPPRTSRLSLTSRIVHRSFGSNLIISRMTALIENNNTDSSSEECTNSTIGCPNFVSISICCPIVIPGISEAVRMMTPVYTMWWLLAWQHNESTSIVWIS